MIYWGGGRKRKDKKTWKSRSEEKVVGLNSASLFPARKRKAIAQGGTIKQQDRPPDGEENPGRLGEQAKMRAHFRYIHVKQE